MIQLSLVIVEDPKLDPRISGLGNFEPDISKNLVQKTINRIYKHTGASFFK